MVNVFGNSVGAACVSHICEHELMETPCDLNTLPDASGGDNIMRYPGGLSEVEFHSNGEIQIVVSQPLK
jgi:hypothetical protein